MAQLAWIADGDGEIFWYNKRWYEYTGTTLDEVRGWGWRRCHHPDHVERVVADLRQSFATGRPFDCTFPLRSASGEYRWFLTRAEPIRNEKGNIVRWFGTNTDITAQRERERFAEENEERLRLAAESAGFGTFDYNPRTGLSVWSDRLKRMVGISAAGPVDPAEVFETRVHPEDRERYRRETAASLDPRGTGDHNIEVRIIRDDGNVRTLRSYGRVLFEEHSDNPRPIRVIGTVADVTEARRQEERLRRAANYDRFAVALTEGLRETSTSSEAQAVAARILGTFLDASRVFYADLDEAGVVRVQHAYFAPGITPVRGIDPDTCLGPFRDECLEGRIITVDDAATDERLTDEQRRHIAEIGHCTAAAIVPLLKPAARPVLLVVHMAEAHAWGPHDLRLLEKTADRTRAAVEWARAESERRRVQASFRRVADAMPQLVWIAAADGRVHYYNARVAEYRPVREQKDGAIDWSPLVHEDDLQMTIDAWAHAVRTGETYQCEHRVLMADGSWRWHLSRAIRADGPGEDQWFGTATDIHDLTITRKTLAEKEERLRLAMVSSGMGAWDYDLRENRIVWDARQRELWGMDLHDGPDNAAAVFERVHPADRPRVLVECKATAESDEVPFNCEFRVIHPDGSVRWLVGVGARIAPSRLIGVNYDITQRKQQERALKKAEQTSSFAQLIGRVGTFEWDIQRDHNRWSAELERLYGLESGGFDGTYDAWLQLVHPDDRERAVACARDALNTGELSSTWRVLLPSGEERVLEARGFVERDADGKPLRMLGVNLDVTERIRHEQQMRTVTAELNHRVKNTLAVVEAIAKQTKRSVASLDEFEAAFGERIRSMSAAHAILTGSEWSGSAISDILDAELALRVADRANLVLNGPHIVLRPKAALALHMAIHELATNAQKYGALAGPSGRVEVEWSIDLSGSDRVVTLVWTEAGGPAPNAAAVDGFGTRMIERMVAYELHGELRRTLDETGLRCTMVFPVDAPARRRPRNEGHHPEPNSDASPPATGGILIAEDNLILADAMAEIVRDLDLPVIGPAETVDACKALLDQQTPAAALLDVDLDGEPSYEVARRLLGMSVPVAFVTGYNPGDLPPELAEVKLIPKPVREDTVAEWLNTIALTGKA